MVPIRFSVGLVFALVLTSGCIVDPEPTDQQFRGSGGVIRLAPSMDGPWLALQPWIHNGISIRTNGTGLPELGFSAWINFTHDNRATGFGSGAKVAPGILDGPAPVKGEDAVLGGRGRFDTDWPMDLSDPSLHQIESWIMDALYVVTRGDSSEDPFDAHMFVQRGAATAGNFRLQLVREARQIAGNNVDERIQVEPKFPKVPVVVNVVLTGESPLTDLEVRVESAGTVVTSARFGGLRGTKTSIEFTPQANLPYEIRIVGRASSEHVIVSAFATLETPVLHFFWEKTRLETIAPSLPAR